MSDIDAVGALRAMRAMNSALSAYTDRLQTHLTRLKIITLRAAESNHRILDFMLENRNILHGLEDNALSTLIAEEEKQLACWEDMEEVAREIAKATIELSESLQRMDDA